MISEKLTHAEKIVILGYSPTGGGHASRALEIVIQAVRDEHLKKDDVVILHLPNIHNAEPKFNPGLAPIDRAAKRLNLRGVHVLMAITDKAVIGHLDNEGCSDNAQILKTFADYPYRAKARHQDITKCAQTWLAETGAVQVYGGDNETYEMNPEKAQRKQIALQNTISAKDLFSSLSNIQENILKKVHVISDMDPYLQKAAKKTNIPDKRRLDQQSHAILIQNLEQLTEKIQKKSIEKGANLIPVEDRLSKENAVLAKVLDGTGSKVNHIALGENNTLQRRLKDTKCLLEALTDRKTISEDTSRKEVKQKVLLVLDQLARKIPLDRPYDGELGGIMHYPNLRLENAQNIVYIYIHGGAIKKIGDHIRYRINQNDSDYNDKVFIFCRKGAINKALCPACKTITTPNAMELAYLAGADGITNTGAGTTGEFAFLHRQGGDKSHIALFPQIDQHEQETNAEYIKKLFESISCPQINPFPDSPIFDGHLKDNFAETIDKLIKRKSAHNGDEGAMKELFDGVLFPNTISTIPKQASDILFGQKNWQEISPDSYEISIAEQHMRSNNQLTANRRYLKLIVKALVELEKHCMEEIKAGGATKKVDGLLSTAIFHFKLKQKDVPILSANKVEDLCMYLKDPALVKNLLDCSQSKNKSLEENDAQKNGKEQIFTNYSKTCSFFINVSKHEYTNEQAQKLSQTLMKELGQQVTLGF